jgi:hypothetical protein
MPRHALLLRRAFERSPARGSGDAARVGSVKKVGRDKQSAIPPAFLRKKWWDCASLVPPYFAFQNQH